MSIIKEIVSWWGGNTWGTRFLIWRQGRLVGTDEFGNQYYEQKQSMKEAHALPRRWVTYRDLSEPSQIPASWHGWLHYTTNEIPTSLSSSSPPWKKKHQMNLTGTAQAYRPQGSILKKITTSQEEIKNYKPWHPND